MTRVSPASAASARAALRALLQKVSARRAELRVGALRQPGAWRDHPLPPNSADAPYWIALPATFEITNLPAPALRAILANTTPEAFGDGGSIMTIQAPTHPPAAPPTRADVSQAVLAKTIATLGAPSPLLPAITAALARKGERAVPQRAAGGDASESLMGDGTALAPFRGIDGQPIYLQASVTLAFPSVPPSALNVAGLFPNAAIT